MKNGYKDDTLKNQVTKNLTPGSIVLFHDIINVEDLREIILEIQRKGFKIVSLQTILSFEKEYPQNI